MTEQGLEQGWDGPEAWARGAALLRAGGLVAFPTETVYGLGADAASPEALARLYSVKGRPEEHPVIVHLPEARALGAWARDIPPAAWALAEAFWPGPLTLILRARDEVSRRVTGGQDTVGLRVPAHPVALGLIRAFGGGVAAPSANRFGRVSPTRAEHVRRDLGGAVDLVLEGGDCRVGVESTILDLSGPRPRLLRPGMLSAVAIEAALGEALLTGPAGLEGAPRVSGALARHYSPVTPVRLVPPEAWERALEASPQAAALSLRPPSPGRPAGPEGWIQAPAEPEGYARQLYGALRALDGLGRPLLLIEQVPQGPGWEAIRDRLGRAAAPEPAGPASSDRGPG